MTESIDIDFYVQGGGEENLFRYFSMFAGEDIEIIGMVSCGGCPGRDALRVLDVQVVIGTH